MQYTGDENKVGAHSDGMSEGPMQYTIYKNMN